MDKKISKKNRIIPGDIDLQKIKQIHMIAICGTGMATLAGLLKEKGFLLTGSDQEVYPPMSTQLEQMGIQINEGFDPNRLKNADLVIVGNVISRGNEELETAFESEIPCLSLPESLNRFFLKDSNPIVVTGTHGKTTTSSLLAFLLDSCGKDPGFFIGGVLENYGKSFRLGSKGAPFVVEGDEYDSACFDKRPKFVHYPPHTAILSGIEFDHADIYNNLDEIIEIFKEFLRSMNEKSVLIANGDDDIVKKILPFTKAKTILYGFGNQCHWQAKEILETEEGVSFQLFWNGKNQGYFKSPLIGKHNLKNLLAVLASLNRYGISLEQTSSYLPQFKGVLRRQQVRGVVHGMTVIDDFAHHPTAVRLTLEGLRKAYPKGNLWAVFEPRTATTRRKIFQKAYSQSFDAADLIIIAPVFKPEKAPPEDRFSALELVNDLKKLGKRAFFFQETDEIVNHVCKEARERDIIAILSNGGFDGIHEKILRKLNEKKI